MDITKSIEILSRAIDTFLSIHTGNSELLQRLPKELNNKEYSDDKIEKDVIRLGFCVWNEKTKEAELIDKNSKSIEYLRRIASKLSSIDEYYQEIMDFMIPIIYTQVSKNEDIEYSKVEHDCIVIYEHFLYKYLNNHYKLALRNEHILRTLPGYYITKPVELNEVQGIMVELASTALWFSRTFLYPDLAYVYAYLLESESHTPYVFFLAAIKIIRDREDTKPFNLKGIKILGPETMKKLIEASKKLDKQIGYKFKDGKEGQRKGLGLFILGGVGVGVAIAAGVIAYTERHRK